MKTKKQVFLFLLLSCLLASGCGDPKRSKLVGTWGIHNAENVLNRLNNGSNEATNGTDERMSFENDDTNASEPEVNESPMTPKMQIQFLGNGKLTTITHMGRVTPDPKQGIWEMISFDQSSNTMKVKCQLGLQQSEHEIEFLDDDTIKLLPPNLAGLKLKLEFRRQK